MQISCVVVYFGHNETNFFYWNFFVKLKSAKQNGFLWFVIENLEKKEKS